MKLPRSAVLLFALLVGFVTTAASATTIDFESTGTPGNWNQLDYAIDGYVFNQTMDNIDTWYWGVQGTGNPGRYAGLNNFGGIGELSRQDGGTFSLAQISFKNWYSGYGPETFVLTGYLNGAVVHTASAASDDTAWQTLSAWFQNVDKVTFELQGNSQFFLVDNIQVSTSAVPEPSAFAFLLAGLAAISVAMHKKRKA